jgi:hypothetical protein
VHVLEGEVEVVGGMEARLEQRDDASGVVEAQSGRRVVEVR